MEALWYCFADLLQADLNKVKEYWNSHRIRKSRHGSISGVMQCNAMQCNAIQCNAMQCNAMQYNTIIFYLNTVKNSAYINYIRIKQLFTTDFQVCRVGVTIEIATILI